MIGFILMISLGWSGDSLAFPSQGADGLATCTGVILPPSQLAYLLKLEAYVKASERMHMLDVDLLKQERNYYRDQLTIATRPPIWYERPSVQRWAGRVETLIAVGLAASAVSLRYDAGRGD